MSNYTNQDAKDQIDLAYYTDPSFVGLSPQYWCHTPMLIAEIKNLVLMNGIDCIPVIVPKSSEEQTDEQDRHVLHMVPVSLCELHGLVVGIHHKKERILLLDDGTGLLDCMILGNEKSSIPIHSQLCPTTSEITCGDFVVVRGKIVVMSITYEDNKEVVHRELHVSFIDRTDSEAETLHFLECMQRDEKWIQAFHESVKNSMEDGTAMPILNAPQVLERLPKNSLGYEGLFSGFIENEEDILTSLTTCECLLNRKLRKQKRMLLYCHCCATSDSTDPHFIFRDALVHVLLRMEVAYSKSFKTVQNIEPFKFDYKHICENDHLKRVANGVVMDICDPSILETRQKRLFQSTFSALREDGILFHLNEHTDEYLLLSVQFAMIPYFEKQRKLHTEPPVYWNCIPKFRRIRAYKEWEELKKNN